MSNKDNVHQTSGVQGCLSEREITLDVESVAEEALKVVEMGYQPELRRDFSVWQILGIGFSLTNSWWGLSSSLVTGIYSGGPIVIVYGVCFMALIATCVGISLSELASIYPNSGGQYFWASQLAPKRYASLLAYLTGMLAWLGAVFTSGSVAFAVGSAFVGVYQFLHPHLTIQRWMVFVAYQGVNIFAFLFNTYGKILPTVASISLYTSLISFIVITIAMLAKSTPKNSPIFVFATFNNQTGWPSPFIAIVVGLINPNWSFACLDAATHMAEEVNHPERMIPIAILGTVAIGFVTAFAFSVSMFFCIHDIEAVYNTPTLVPILEMFHQGLKSVAGAVCLEMLIIFTGIGCLVSCQTWMSRLAWSFARDRGLPGSKYWAHVNPRLGVPLAAHTISSVVVAILGLLFIGSTTAFNSMLTACITLLYVSYSIPVICLLKKGRNNIAHGPFWMGKFGAFSNYILLFWTAFTLVMYSFPYTYPVLPSTMNYVSAVYAICFGLIGLDWYFRGRRVFRTGDERHNDAIRGAPSLVVVDDGLSPFVSSQ